MHNKIQIELLMLPFTLYNGNKSIKHVARTICELKRNDATQRLAERYACAHSRRFVLVFSGRLFAFIMWR